MGAWPHSFLKSILDGSGGAKERRRDAPVASVPVHGPGTQWIGVPAGPACSLFNIPTELSRLHTLRFVYGVIMDEWWSRCDSGTTQSWTNRSTTICLAASNQPGTPYYMRTALRLYQVAGSYNQTSHLCPSCNYSRSEVWRLTDIFECPSILNPPITFALITILRFAIDSYSSFYDRQKKYQLNRAKTDGEQKIICPSLYCRRDPSHVDKGKEWTATINPNSMFILLLRMASLGKWTKDFHFIFLFTVNFAFPETLKESVLFILYTSHSMLLLSVSLPWFPACGPQRVPSHQRRPLYHTLICASWVRTHRT